MRAYSKNIKKYRLNKSNKRVRKRKCVRKMSKKRVRNKSVKNIRRKNYKRSRRSRRQRGGYTITTPATPSPPATQSPPAVQESCEPSTAESNKQAFFNSFTETNQSDSSSSQRVCDYVGENSSGKVAYSCL